MKHASVGAICNAIILQQEQYSIYDRMTVCLNTMHAMDETRELQKKER